ncbi:MAG: VWA domain-containing protein [Gemmatimonadetes bacterium]|nr:VWA domain-containing protein [Gemmatimonadota bacterium]
MIAFDSPLLLYLAPVVTAVIAVLALFARRARVSRAIRWSPELGRLAHGVGRHGWVTPAFAAFFATVALSGPRWGRRTVSAESKALNLVIAVDISRSMLAEDVAPSRLGRAQRESRRLIQDLGTDRIGLIAFAGQSFIMSPLTVDGGALQLLVEGLDPDISSVGGTAFTRVLVQASGLLLGGVEVADRVLVVFTDGEAHDSLPEVLAAAEQLRQDGVRLILVAEGGREPTTIPLRSLDGTVIGEQRDVDGTVVQTWRRDAVLTAIADAAQGAVVPAGLKDQAGAVRELVLGFKRSPQATAVTASRVPRAWIPLLIASTLLLLHTLTRRTAALIVLVLLAGAPGVLRAQGLKHAGDAAWERGDFRHAAERYIEDVRAGRGGDTAWLNAGTAGLAVGDSALVTAALGRAAESLDPEIRFGALYNLGLAQLRLAARDSANRERYLAEARRRYREALLLKPGDQAAKRNLELAIRQSPPQGGGASPNPNPQGGVGQPPERPQPRGGLSASQAEQILNSMAEEERRTRQQQRRRMSQSHEPTGAQDW